MIEIDATVLEATKCSGLRGQYSELDDGTDLDTFSRSYEGLGGCADSQLWGEGDDQFGFAGYRTTAEITNKALMLIFFQQRSLFAKASLTCIELVC